MSDQVAVPEHSDHIITAFAPDKRDDADAYAASIGGWVTEGYNEYGWVAVRHAYPIGLHVPIWSSMTIPPEAFLVPRSTVSAGDEVISSHYGRRTVLAVTTQGTGAGTTTLRLQANTGTSSESYPGDSLIPVIWADAAAEPEPLDDLAALIRDILLAEEYGDHTPHQSLFAPDSDQSRHAARVAEKIRASEWLRAERERIWTEGRESIGLDLLKPTGSDGVRQSTPNPYRLNVKEA